MQQKCSKKSEGEKMRQSTESQALKHRSRFYPERYKGKVPKTVKMTETVTSDLPGIIKPILFAYEGQEYDVLVNPNGAVTAITPEGELGLKPNEFEVIGWHLNPKESEVKK